MGIKGLTKFLRELCPESIKEKQLKHYSGLKVVIDASMLIYQYLVTVRITGRGEVSSMLTNADGEETSHLQGILTVVVRLMESGIKPLFVFDGKPPKMKSGTLSKRQENREIAEEALKEAKETGSIEDVNKFSKRLVKMTSKHIMECKILLGLMGIPVIEAPSEAESECAHLVKSGYAFGMASEDMDSLCFDTPKLLRYFTAAKAKNLPILEFDRDKVLTDLKLTRDQFIDLCILLGCDYCETIRGIGPKTAFKLIQEHGCIEEIIKHLDKEKYGISSEWPYKEARQLFITPEVSDPTEPFVWLLPNYDGMIEFLCKEKGFDVERVKKIHERLVKSRGKASSQRLDNFFQISYISSSKKKEEKPVEVKAEKRPSSSKLTNLKKKAKR